MVTLGSAVFFSVVSSCVPEDVVALPGVAFSWQGLLAPRAVAGREGLVATHAKAAFRLRPQSSHPLLRMRPAKPA
eukprot:scaffold1307_cov200-Pinguiococcus_pyrenoidosus.AAC.128